MCLTEELRVGRVLQGEHANKALCGLEKSSVENGQNFECGFSPDLLVKVIATKTGRKEIIIPEVNMRILFFLIVVILWVPTKRSDLQVLSCLKAEPPQGQETAIYVLKLV